EDLAIPGSRTAVNLSGINTEQVKRGDIIAYPGSYQPTRRIDVKFKLLADVPLPLKHDTMVKFFIGAAEVLARVRVWGSEELHPGEEGWLQLELEEPVVAIRGDRYILRRPSPGETLGGGVIIDPHSKGRHKRFSGGELARLELLSRGTPAEILLQALTALGIASLQDVISRSNLDATIAKNAAQELVTQGDVITLDNSPGLAASSQSLVISRSYCNQLKRQVLQEVGDYHKVYPLRGGMPREELKSRLKLISRPYNAILHLIVADGDLVETGAFVRLTNHAIRFNSQQQLAADGLLKRFASAPYSPPSAKECITEVGDELYNAMLESGWLVSIPPDVVFRKQDYERMVSEVINLLQGGKTITAAEVRDHFNTSRRYVLALLEHLDARGITVREGDIRRLK
ncbi:MAG: selenocysteine-specific translation factor, partial [Anaerolineae bacterium]|nr:selenocysteine-specific translation factor [Anaerolineae bacterium]